MGGPTYHYDEENPSTTKFPEYWDDKAFMASSRATVSCGVQPGRTPTVEVTKIEDFLPNAALNDRRACPSWTT